jgi:hypothetical protein
LEHLAPEQRVRLERYALPRLPHRFLEAFVPTRQLEEAAERRRKERSDVLVPLVHILVALVRFRKNAAGRLVEAFRAAVGRIEAGEASLPLAFGYDAVLADVNRDATAVADLHRVDRPMPVRCLLWDPASCVREHPDASAGPRSSWRARVDRRTRTPRTSSTTHRPVTTSCNSWDPTRSCSGSAT